MCARVIFVVLSVLGRNKCWSIHENCTLFHVRDNLSEFTSAVSSPAEASPSQKRTAASYTRVLFQTLHGIMTNGYEEARLAVIEGAPHLLDTLLLQNRYMYITSNGGSTGLTPYSQVFTSVFLFLQSLSEPSQERGVQVFPKATSSSRLY